VTDLGKEQEYDREAVRKIPNALEWAGYEVAPLDGETVVVSTPTDRLSDAGRCLPVLEPDPPVRGPRDLPILVDAVIGAALTLELTWSAGRAEGSAFALAGPDGSGFVVVTTAHLLDPDPTITIETAGGERGPAELVALDPRSDLALLRSSVALSRALRSRSDVRVGEPVIAVGCPHGLRGTVTAGIVSAIGRHRTLPVGADIPNALQFDALIDMGNSGGPLIGWDARVLGVCQAQQRDVAGARAPHAFAIPIAAAIALAGWSTGAGEVQS
jgi:S1-C subfamily serine protease